MYLIYGIRLVDWCSVFTQNFLAAILKRSTVPPQIVIIEHKSIICPGYNAVLHIHTCIEEVQIAVRLECGRVAWREAELNSSGTVWRCWLCLCPRQALICMVDKKTGEKSKTRPRFVKQDQVCIARLRTAGTICLETFKEFPQMGRFTLRDEGRSSSGLELGAATVPLVDFFWGGLYVPQLTFQT